MVLDPMQDVLVSSSSGKITNPFAIIGLALGIVAAGVILALTLYKIGKRRDPS